MSKYEIELTTEESALVAQIDLRDRRELDGDGHETYKKNIEPILALLESLTARGGIPEHRIALWIDPALNTGRIKGSYRDLFARNGQKGKDAYIHPHFKTYLRYFLYGANLPQDAIDEFERQVGNPEWFSGSDIIALTKKTREIVRKYGLRDSDHADEFQRLALDVGLDAYHANEVRSAAVQAARR